MEDRQGNRGRIVIAASQVAGTYFLPQKLLSFTEAYSDIKVDIQTRTDDEIEKLVQTGAVDIGLTLKFPENHLFFRITEFSRDRFIGIQTTAPIRKQTLLIPKDCYFMFNRDSELDIIKMNSIEAVKHFVKEGMGYGVILESAAKLKLVHGELDYWSGYTPQDAIANVITRPAERLSNSIWYFLNHIRKYTR
ncbi:substrate-binding domain-containing protein [Cytobacillus praedii]|uniref:substrate-binding domain-containing protein n=1 Tax=Cytobacillus praedii TaxID=1742358 RepID=UPI002E1CA2EF|nr:substrate-binding domain-containing protein [Cytobacillus praedii]